MSDHIISYQIRYHIISHHIISHHIISHHHILSPEDIFYLQKTYSVSRRHISCLQTIHIESIYIIQGPNPKNPRFSLFPRIQGWPLGYEIPSSLILFQGSRAHFRLMILKCSESVQNGPEWLKIHQKIISNHYFQKYFSILQKHFPILFFYNLLAIFRIY